MSFNVTPGKLSLNDLSQIYWESHSVTLSPDVKKNVEKAAAFVQDIAKSDTPIYGINTGFGKLSGIRIPAEKTDLIQRNLILSHCCGVGDPLPEKIVFLVMVLKILSLGRGASGVRWKVIEQIEFLFDTIEG